MWLMYIIMAATLIYGFVMLKKGLIHFMNGGR